MKTQRLTKGKQARRWRVEKYAHIDAQTLSLRIQMNSVRVLLGRRGRDGLPLNSLFITPFL